MFDEIQVIVRDPQRLAGVWVRKCRYIVLSCIAIGASSCTRSDSKHVASADSRDPTTIESGVTSAEPARVDTLSLQQAIDSLRRLPGDFVRQPANALVLEFVGDRTIFRHFRWEQRLAVAALIECMNSDEKVLATFNLNTVSLSYMCYSAYSRVRPCLD